jgi:tetratricopeptide (TPR) repeat protein
LLNTLHNLAGAYRQAGRTADAIALFEDVYGRSAKKVGPGHPRTLNTLGSLASALQDHKQFDRAAAAYRKWLDTPRKSPDPLSLAGTQAALGLCLLQAGKPAEAEPVLRDSLAVRQQKQPDAWATFDTQALLGAALLGQKKYAEAEPLLVSGYEGMKQREAKIPPKLRATRLAEAAQRLVQFYEATGQDEKAAAWRKTGKGSDL